MTIFNHLLKFCCKMLFLMGVLVISASSYAQEITLEKPGERECADLLFSQSELLSKSTYAASDSNVTLLKTVSFTETITDVYVSGDLAFTGGYYFFRILDISDLNSPVVLSTLDLDSIAVEDIHVQDDYAYLAAGNDGLYIIDISTPESPALAGSLNVHNSAKRICVSGDYAYIQDRLVTEEGLLVVDISDPTQPVESAFLDVEIKHDIAFSDNYVYGADCAQGVRIIDVNDPANPILVNTFQGPTIEHYAIHVSGNYAYVTEWIGGDGMVVFDISDKQNPVEVATCLIGARDIFIEGNYAYGVGYIDSTLSIVDISSPDNPVSVGHYYFNSYWGNRIFVSDGVIFVAGYPEGLVIFRNDHQNKITSVDDDEPAFPDSYSLDDNYPNPFNPETNIRFTLPQPIKVTLKIYNMAGQLVKTLTSESLPSGNHQYKWNGTNDRGQKVGSGVYIYRLQAGKYSQTKKMLLIK